MRLHTLIEGEQRTISFLQTANGRRPAERFLKTKVPKKVRGKIFAFLGNLADEGQVWARPPWYKKLQSWKLWELREGQVRIICFQHGRNIILTIGVIKKTDRHRVSDLKRADRMRKQYLRTKNPNRSNWNGENV